MKKQGYLTRALTGIILLSILLSAMAACDKLPTGKQPTPIYTQPTQPVKSTSPSTGAQIPAATNILVSQDIVRSDKEQTVSWKDQVKVVLPAGLVDTKQTLTISPSPSLPPPIFGGLVGLGGFDISMGNLHEFKKEIIIEIAYDPTKIVSDLPPDKALIAAYWNPDQKVWVTSPAQVDTQKNVVIIRTDHLTNWKVYYLVRGYEVNQTDHFTIVYDKKAWPTVGPKGGKVPQEPVGFATNMGIRLEQAWSQYVKIGFPMPNEKRWRDYLYSKTLFGVPRLLVFIDKNTVESQTITLTGSLYLKFDYDSDNQVRHDSAHELFHSFQMEASGLYRYIARHWWMDATADYVADKLAWNGLGTMSEVHATYFADPLNTVDEVHEYDSARFIDYIVQKEVNPALRIASFKDLWDQSVKNSSNDMVQFLEGYVPKKTPTATLHDYYREFATYILFDGSSPLEGGRLMNKVSPLINAKQRDAPKELAADKTEITYPFTLKSGYTAGVWAFSVKPKNPTTDRRLLRIEITGEGLPPATEVEAALYMLKNDQRPPGGVKPEGILNALHKSIGFSVGKDDVVYIVALNAGASSRSLTLKVSDSALTISPATVSVDAGKNVTFTTPGVTGKVLWSVQEGANGGTISAAGVYTAPTGSGTYHVVATLDSDRAKTGTATVTVTVASLGNQNIMAILQKTTKLQASVTLRVTWDFVSTTNGHSVQTSDGELVIPPNKIPITWSGASFSGKAEDVVQNTVSQSIKTTYTLSGSVSSDGKTLISLMYVKQERQSVSGNVVEEYTTSLGLSNVPLYFEEAYHHVIGSQAGTAVGKYVTKFEFGGRKYSDTRKISNTQATNESELWVEFR